MPTKAQIAAAKADVQVQRARRNTKPAAQPQPAAANTDAMAFDISALEDIQLPSWKRVLCGAILGLAAAGTVGYGIGCIMGYALAGVATLVGAGALAFCLNVLIWVLGIYSAWKVGGWVAGKVFSSVVLPDGLAARSIDSMSNAASDLKGWFTSKPAVQRVAAARDAFNGTHVPA